MAKGISARLSAAAQGRKFGVTIGIAFLILAALGAWRGRSIPAIAFGVLAGVLLIGALVVPAQLVPVERLWMRLALVISKVTTPIFMGVVWFLVLTPTAWIRRALGKNQIARDRRAPTFWVSREPGRRRGDLERQF